MTGVPDEPPAERLARWISTDAAIGRGAEAEQMQAQLAERVAEIADLRARLAQLASRVAQVESENAALRAVPGTVRLAGLARRVYRRARSAAASRWRR